MTAFTGEIHPYADAFPMLDEESLKALAEDIAANGQRHPILLDPNGVLIDGRNRLRACEIAGLKPKFEIHDGDPIKLIVSENMQRRDLTQGQKAYLALLTCTNLVQREIAAIAGVPLGRIQEAMQVRQYAPHLVQQVIDGVLGHSRAYEVAKRAKREAAERERKHEEMQTKAADLLARMDEDFTFEMAWVAYQERDKERIAEERYRAEARKNYADSIWGAIQGLTGHDASDERRELFNELDLRDTPTQITVSQIDLAIAILQRVKKEKIR